MSSISNLSGGSRIPHEAGTGTVERTVGRSEKSDLEEKLAGLLKKNLAANSTNPNNASKRQPEYSTTDTNTSTGSHGANDDIDNKAEKREVHHTKCGYATVQGRLDWLQAHGVTKKDDQALISNSLVAELDPSAPLFYWQLYSLLGVNRIRALVTIFYKHVYTDDDKDDVANGPSWFKKAFVRVSSEEHHVETQTQFWVDVMGGGRHYHGGDQRLRFHHTNNADAVMNARGAQRWMFHMRAAVAENERNKANSFAAVDSRVLPCLKDFLRTKMMKYATEHRWQFENKDFDNFPQ